MDELEEIRRKKLEELERRHLGKNEQAVNTPVQVTDANFSDFIKEHRVVVVDFWSQWCMPCRIIAPILDELAKEYAGKVVFAKLDVEGNQTTAVAYGITAIPALLIFKDGKLVDRIIGAYPKPQIEEKIKKIIE
jgi:thioredoxin 1